MVGELDELAVVDIVDAKRLSDQDAGFRGQEHLVRRHAEQLYPSSGIILTLIVVPDAQAREHNEVRE